MQEQHADKQYAMGLIVLGYHPPSVIKNVHLHYCNVASAHKLDLEYLYHVK